MDAWNTQGESKNPYLANAKGAFTMQEKARFLFAGTMIDSHLAVDFVLGMLDATGSSTKN